MKNKEQPSDRMLLQYNKHGGEANTQSCLSIRIWTRSLTQKGLSLELPEERNKTIIQTNSLEILFILFININIFERLERSLFLRGRFLPESNTNNTTIVMCDVMCHLVYVVYAGH